LTSFKETTQDPESSIFSVLGSSADFRLPDAPRFSTIAVGSRFGRGGGTGRLHRPADGRPEVTHGQSRGVHKDIFLAPMFVFTRRRYHASAYLNELLEGSPLRIERTLETAFDMPFTVNIGRSARGWPQR